MRTNVRPLPRFAHSLVVAGESRKKAVTAGGVIRKIAPPVSGRYSLAIGWLITFVG